MQTTNQNNALNRPFSLSRLFLVIVVLILLIGNGGMAYKYYCSQNELNVNKALLEKQTINKKILNFAKLFVSNVLKAEGEIDFETRLKLESAVRELDDEEVLNKWQLFVNSKTEDAAQNNVKDLLEILMNKI